MATMTDTPAPERRSSRKLLLLVLAVALATVAPAAFLLWPRPSDLERAHEQCGIGEMRGKALVVEVDGFILERVSVAPEYSCLLSALHAPSGDQVRGVLREGLAGRVDQPTTVGWDDITVQITGSGDRTVITFNQG